MYTFELKNLLELRGDWNVFKGRVKQGFGRLTDNYRGYAEGKEDESIGRIQRRTGAARRALERVLRAARKRSR
jgi:uncharacterized protein YjbJ (UPF0337 family)